MARNKEARVVRRNLAIRQAVILGLLVAGLGVLGFVSWGMFTGQLTPWWDKQEFYAKPTPSLQINDQPCPLAPDSAYPEPTTVAVNVLNASNTSGAAAAAAAVLEQFGFVTTAGNDPTGIFGGGVKVVTGLAGVDNAYAVLVVLPKGTVIEMDHRTDQSVDVVLGEQAQPFPGLGEVDYEPAALIVPVPGCLPASELATAPVSTPPAT